MNSIYNEKQEEWKKRRAWVLERQETGTSINDLAKELNISVSQVNSLIKKAKRDRLKT